MTYLRWNQGSQPSAAARNNELLVVPGFIYTTRIARAVTNNAKASGNIRKLFERTGGESHITITIAEAIPARAPCATRASHVSTPPSVTSPMKQSETSE